MIRFSLRCLMIPLTCLAIAGCSMLQPYLDVDTASYTAPGMPGHSLTPRQDFADAVAYANWVQTRYREAVADSAAFANYSNLSLLQIGLATIGMGAAGVSGDEILIAGLGASSLYGSAALLRSNPRDLAYLTGFGAVQCAIDAVTPLDESTIGDFPGFESLVVNDDDSSLSDQLRTLEEEWLEQREQNGWVDTRLNERQRTLLNLGRVALDEGRDAARQGRILYQDIKQSPATLTDAVSRITHQVDLAVVRTIPDTAAVALIISNLDSIYSQFTAVPESLMPVLEGDGTVAADDVRITSGKPDAPPTLESYLEAIAQVRESTHIVNNVIAAVQERRPLGRLRECGVDPDQIVKPLSLEPSDRLQLTAGKSARHVFQIKGGTESYGVNISGGSTDHLRVEQLTPLGSGFVVIAEQGITAGTHTVVVMDGGGHMTTLNIQVVPPAHNDDPGSSEQTDKQAMNAITEAYKDLTTEQTTDWQTLICMSDDPNIAGGKYGPKTQEQTLAYLVKKGLDLKALSENKLSVWMNDEIKANNDADFCNEWRQELLVEAASATSPFGGRSFGSDAATSLVISVNAVDPEKQKIELNCTGRPKSMNEDDIISSFLSALYSDSPPDSPGRSLGLMLPAAAITLNVCPVSDG